MSFSITPKTAFRRPQSDGFPQGIQWEVDGTVLGDRHVQTVNLAGFGSGGVTRDADTLTINAPTSAAAAAQTVKQGVFTIVSGLDTIDLTGALFTSTNPADFWVWAKALNGAWVPVLPASNLGNVAGLATFSISGGSMSFTNLAAFTEGGDILIRQLA